MPTPSEIEPLLELLANLSDTRMERLANVLSYGENALKINATGEALLLDHVYSRQSIEPNAKKFHQFLRDNEVTSIPAGNSKLFRVTPWDAGTKPFVLKREAWSMDSDMEKWLRLNPETSALLAPIYGERQVTCKKSLVKIQVLPLYVGDVYALTQLTLPDEERTSQALRVYSHMARIYEVLREADIVFPDGKNANWLLEDPDNIIIADTKTFLYAPNGRLTTGLEQYQNYFMSIPEKGPYVADKVHALHLGKNLYQFLTQCDHLYLLDPKSGGHAPYNEENGCDATMYDFGASIFQTHIGHRLQSLIKNTVQINPNNRLPVRDVLLELSALKQLLAQDMQQTQAKLASNQSVPIANNRINSEINVIKAKLRDIKIEYTEPTNEPLKAKILSDFENSLVMIGTLVELHKAVNLFKRTDDYQTLVKAPKPNTQNKNVIAAFQDVIDEARDRIVASRDWNNLK